MVSDSSNRKRHPAFAGSLLLNLGLAGTVIWLLADKSAEQKLAPASVPVSPPAVQALETPLKTPAPRREISFNWSQLESTNYLTYIENLRRIDCPEQTIRDIIQADLASLYESRRQEVRGDDLFSNQKQMEIQRLNAEQSVIFNSLSAAVATGHQPPPAQFGGAAQMAAAPRPGNGNAQPSALPAASADPYAAGPGSGIQTADALASLPPTDQEEMVRTLYGYEALAQYQANPQAFSLNFKN